MKSLLPGEIKGYVVKKEALLLKLDEVVLSEGEFFFVVAIKKHDSEEDGLWVSLHNALRHHEPYVKRFLYKSTQVECIQKEKPTI
jgi:hypothetical protein